MIKKKRKSLLSFNQEQDAKARTERHRIIKRLYLDIETTPNLVFSWRVGYKINIDYENIVKERAVVCIGYKWQGKAVECLQWDAGDDKRMIKTIAPILESADEVVAHYGDRFDLPWLRARAAKHGIEISPYLKTIDTKAQSARLFYFNSNKLDYLSQFLLGRKKIETDFKLWKDVVAGNPKALRTMVAYCKRDVELLENVYLTLENYHKPKTHYGVLWGGDRTDCPRCGSSDTMRVSQKVTGMGTTNPIMKCRKCKGQFITTAAALRDKHAKGVQA